MITFYKADETDFDNNGLGVLDRDIQNPDIEEKINDIFTFSFNYPIFAVNGARLAARMIVKADDPENSGQLFRILKLSKSNGMLTAFCYHIFYDLNGNEIPDTNIVGQNGQTAITQMLSKTAVAHKFQGFSDIAETANIRVVRMSPVKFLIDPQTDNNFINRLGGEIRRVNYRIWMNKVRGTDNGATIRWKKSLDSYNATWDYTTIATRIRPVGYNGIMLPESYVDSPLIDKYETIVIKEIQYSDIKAIDPNATSNDETAVPLEQAYELLRQAAAKEFSENNLDKPTVTLSVNMVALRNMDEYKDVKSLETINPWDTVTVINERDDLSVKVRLNHYHWNPVTHKFISMELGNSKSTFTDIGSKVDHATNIANQANDTANHASASADGKNTIYRDVKHEDIVNPVNGDTCFEKNGDKEEIWIYNGKSVPPSWELIVDDATGEEVRQNVDAAQKEAEEAKKQANKAVDGANDAVAEARFANDTAEEAKSDAASALQKALDAYAHGDQIKTGLTADIDAVKGQLSLKANQVDVDKLGGRVTSAEAQIKLQADQIALTVSKTELTNILGDYATQTWTQSQIKSTADQINLSVSKVQNNLDNLQIGSRNYVRNSDFSNGINEWGVADNVWHVDQQTTLDGVHEVIGYTTIPYTGGAKNGIYQTMPSLPDNVSVAVSFYAKASKDGAVLHSEPNGSVGAKDFTLTTEWKRYSYFGSIKNSKAVYWMMKTVGVNYWLAKPQVEVGNKVTDYHMATEDYATEVQYSQLQVTVNGIQGTVQNKADKSQVTQLANQITSVVKSSSNPNLIPNSGHPKDITYWNTNKSGALGIAKHAFYEGNNTNLFYLQNDSATAETTAGTVHVPVTPGATYTLSGVFFAGSNVVGADVWFLSRPASNTSVGYTKTQLLAANVKFNPSAAERIKYTFTVPGDVTEGYVRIDNNGSSSGSARVYFAELKLERGENYTAWVYDDALSQITQLADDINLRVEKNKIVNQINISPEGILIDGKKVHITGQTSIDKAVIKDAMIADIRADKITAGTLNAANVNVINLNANNITTGTIKGANLSMNLNTGEVVFQHGRIHSASNNVDVNIDQGYLSTASNDTRVMLKEGQLQLVQPNIFDNSKDPYLEISNSVGGASFNGANIIARDYLVLANRANSNAFFDAPIDGPETFAGLAVGKSSSDRWKPTRIGGAERGIIMRGGTAYKIDSSFMFKNSPEIFVGTDEAGLTPGDRIYINGSYVHIKSAYWRTASGSANLIVSQDGALVRATSASKYKTDIVRTNKSDYGNKLLDLPTATWVDIAETKRFRDDPLAQPKPKRNFGMIAEDLADAGLEMLVVRGTDGELEGINYDRIGPALIPVIAKLKNEVEILKQKLEEKTA